MEFLTGMIDFFIHLDDHINSVVAAYGNWTYALLFLIIFCETGLVVTPFLPGDSLLFVVGTLAADGPLDVRIVLVLLTAAAILGDNVNYAIGHCLASKIFRNEKIPLLNEKHLERTRQFYARYGAKTIILARFVPIVRTFAPFLAGVGEMDYPRFLAYNVTGGILWICLLVLGGYYFGNIPIVEKNFTLVVFAIIIISFLPPIIEVIRQRKS